MARSRYRRPFWRPLLFLCIIAAVIYMGYSVYPLGYTLVKGQPYLNPRVKTRPQDDYRLELWVKLPTLKQNEMEAALEQSIAQFCSDHPNFEINITYLNADKAMAELQLALFAANPPDLFFHADSSQAYFGELQIPLHMYTEPVVQQSWPAAVWQQAAIANRVYALPVALYPRVLMINTDLWQPPSTDATAWTWQQFQTQIEAAKGPGVYGFVPTSAGDEFFAALTAAWGLPAALDYDGSPLWDSDQIIAWAEAWTQLSQNEAVPSPIANIDKDCLSLFLAQKAACIGPLNHNLAAWLWERAAASGMRAEFLPMPSQGGHSDMRPVYLSAFRQTPWQGQRHTKATAELAHWLVAELGEQLGRLTGAVPAQTQGLASLDYPYSQASFAVYADTANVLPTQYTYGPEPGVANEHWAHSVAPAWEKFVTGQYTREQFADALLNGLARATIAGP